MNNYPFDTTGLCEADVDSFDEAYKTLKSKLNISLTGHIDFDLKQFEVFKNYTDVNLLASYLIKHFDQSSYVLFLQTNYIVRNIRERDSSSSDCQIWALAYLKNDFGRVLIRRETLADKLIELVHPVEIDFADDKAFSDTFYVLANDFQKTSQAMNRNFRNAVMDMRHEDVIIEIAGHTLIIGTQKPVNTEKAIHLAEFVARVSTMC